MTLFKNKYVGGNCKSCTEKGLHVCIPEVVKLLKADPGFRKLVKTILKE